MNLSSLTETELKEALMLKEKLDGFQIQDECQSTFINYVEDIRSKTPRSRRRQVPTFNR